jgi:hypothetical protein
VSPHFNLGEFLPHGWDGTVPAEVLGNIITLTEQLLEPARAHMDRVIHVNSGWRPPAHNAEVGGATSSDHLEGAAADIWPEGDATETWQSATLRLFEWMRANLAGRFGQLILEDRRVAEGSDNALLIHVSLPTAKHPGDGHDPSAVLVSHAMGHYKPYEEPRA